MNEFYHVSRRDITGIGELKLHKFEGSISSETLHSDIEFKEYKNILYPDGLSSHGEIYLHNPFKSTGPNLAFTPNEFMLETTFELVRRLRFPEMPSRFVSCFACLNIEDARRIRKETFNNQGTIYKVSRDSFHKADMSLLRQAGSVIGIQIVAEKYWSGQSSTTPFWEVLMRPPVRIIERMK